jgi:Na+/melibiose symporter-like transporter
VTILMCLSICNLPTPTVSSNNFSKPSNSVSKDFTSLLTPLFLSSLANAISATTFIFYVTDYLIFSEKEGGLLLGIYFVCALLGIWFWQKFIRIKSPLSVYILSIMATLVVFIPAGFLTKNNADAFYLVCVLSGLTLGAELILPSILLIAKLKHLRMENKSGVVFGSWSLLVKLALAVAAGLSLPILGYFKYTPGEDTGLFMLPVVYVVVPVLLKIATMILLVIHHKKYANIYRQTHI